MRPAAASTLAVRERRRFAGCAHRADAGRACRRLKIDLFPQPFVVDGAVTKGRDDRDGETRELLGSSGHRWWLPG
jgi:hypothetical protein